MAGNTDFDTPLDIELPYADTAELKANQSVRATFRLSENTILTLNIVSNQLRIKQKSLFDHLISDTDALEAIARELKRSRHRREGSVQKTFVVSRRTLATLQKMAETHAASRDALVEFSIQRLKPVIEQEKRKFDSRQRLAQRIKTQLDSQKKLLKEAKKHLGADDPLCEHLSQAVEKCESEYRSIAAYVEKSKRIKDLNMS